MRSRVGLLTVCVALQLTVIAIPFTAGGYRAGRRTPTRLRPDPREVRISGDSANGLPTGGNSSVR